MPLHYVACLADLHQGRITAASLGEQKLVLLRVGDAVYAYQGTCPMLALRWQTGPCAMTG